MTSLSMMCLKPLNMIHTQGRFRCLFKIASKEVVCGATCESGTKKTEIIATGVFAGTSNEQVQSFLWVRLPCNVCSDVTKLILLSLECIVLSKPCIRMLRNYCKRGSMKAWCYKSAYFSSIGLYIVAKVGLKRIVLQKKR
ncbi:uncharacterized protein EV154DRAFT_221364 [Mucor mucedo]|uniref:uncharacterized protein n=1 Tax=Mucor mucedo TaxID=29922 RepID=UPI00221E3E43|nr:uncharacterized protein EV154DRAFT_221364 [Mucor mucedo]KAI7891557.1 hypothetical protein EV154DRAFT_221364 [Mucor mucedo]